MNLTAIDIRPLATREELAACVEMQRDTWGRTFSDVVPASILKVSQRVGGVSAGAFTSDGTLVGFVFGLTGVEPGSGGGRLVHWSDMLAVRPDLRSAGIGRRLKEYQRQVVRSVGVEVIYWTYDPLVARNAHLNFNVLGVRATEYVEDMYGETDSDLHRGIGTDRFVVAWPTDDARILDNVADAHAVATDRAFREAPVVNTRLGSGEAGDEGRDGTPDRARIEVPLDIHELQSSNAREAAQWRRSTRPAFTRALAAGLSVRGFVVDDCARRGYYLLGRAE